ncbi:TIGR02302 family protein [Methyloligella sp. 2.7D]|uniref:TIGR02302 family protein n=1 Tax=unclassified Methyloligella TaxID=2625955 RepID=UPI00157D4E8E|nr:TIGR02302 family protein [Methyloligella sp. GL2]QKP76474.1 TIGR02302 family protein [Methyloligella sp. GL2]
MARAFDRRVRLSRLALFAERVWEALLWPGLVVAAFLVITLLGVWGYMPALLHRLLLGGFAVALLVSLLPLIRIRLPRREEAVRRLERKAGVQHRPASSYEDSLSGPVDADTHALWAVHRRRLAETIKRLKPSWPAPRNDRRDPYAIRGGLFLLLFVAIVIAGPNLRERLASAFSPAPSQSQALLRLDAWVTPPVYTGQAPIVLADGSEQLGGGAGTFRALSIPERSNLVVRANAPEGESVKLTLKPDQENAEAVDIEPLPGKSGLIEFQEKILTPGTAQVSIAGNTVASWRFGLIDDKDPTIKLSEKPTTTPRSALRLAYAASDDYGVASAEARFALVNASAANDLLGGLAGLKAGDDPLLQPPVINLPLTKANAREVQGRATQDLTAHPWAGLPVAMTLYAKDQAGQTGSSETYRFILPERQFTEPLAKAVVEQRKKLVRDRNSADNVMRALDALTLGGKQVIPDPRVYLGLRSTYWRLADDRSPEAIASVVEQLWDIALRIEDGDLPEAERKLKAAQKALQDALQNGASPQEIQQRMDELRQALADYMQQLAQQAQEKGNLPQEGGPPQTGQEMMSQQNLDQMLDNIEKLAQAGSNEMAEQMLSELDDVLNRLQTGTFSDNARQQRMRRLMQELGDLIDEQQELLDQTYQANRQDSQGQDEGFEVSPPGSPMQFGRPGMMFPELYGQQPQNGQSQQQGQQQGQQGQQGQQQGQQPGGQLGQRSGQGQQQGQKGQGQGQRGQRQGQGGELADRQGELMEQLQKLIDSMRINGADAPEELGDAGQSMGQAQDSIDQNDLNSATQQQGMAVDAMRQGAQSMAQQMMQNAEGQQSRGQGQNGRDPLGRPDQGSQPDQGLSVKVPDQIDIQRAREVLDELRNRLGDPNRPMIELDYLERLIRSY